MAGVSVLNGTGELYGDVEFVRQENNTVFIRVIGNGELHVVEEKRRCLFVLTHKGVELPNSCRFPLDNFSDLLGTVNKPVFL